MDRRSPPKWKKGQVNCFLRTEFCRQIMHISVDKTGVDYWLQVTSCQFVQQKRKDREKYNNLVLKNQ